MMMTAGSRQENDIGDEIVARVEHEMGHEAWDYVNRRLIIAATLNVEKSYWADMMTAHCATFNAERAADEQEIARITAQRDELLAENKTLKAAWLAVADLIDNSDGVAGLHKNGDVATWGELSAGGRYESWLLGFDEASKLIKRDAQGRVTEDD